MKTSIAIILLVLSLASPAHSGPSSVAELAASTGADRDRLLLEGAKKETKVVWYTVLTPFREIAKIFESKYPGVTVEAYRTGSADLTKRILTEARTGRHSVDVIEAPVPTLMALRESGLLVPYTSPHLARHPEVAKEYGPRGLVFWTVDQESFISVGYNKNLIPAADVPKSFADLLRPGLRGKLAMEGGSLGARVIGAMLTANGEAFVRRFKEQSVSLYVVSGGALNELVVAGEVAISPNILHFLALRSAGKGAPVAWVPMDLVVANAGGAAVYAHAQRPHAALLFADFLISLEGQKIMEEQFKFGSPLKEYSFQRWYPWKGMTVTQYDEAESKWLRLLREIGLKK